LIRWQIAADPSGTTRHQSDLPHTGQGLSRLTRCILSAMPHLLQDAEIDLQPDETVNHIQDAGPFGGTETRVLEAEHESGQDLIDSRCLQ
jgi:hypothetical protein